MSHSSSSNSSKVKEREEKCCKVFFFLFSFCIKKYPTNVRETRKMILKFFQATTSRRALCVALLFRSRSLIKLSQLMWWGRKNNRRKLQHYCDDDWKWIVCGKISLLSKSIGKFWSNFKHTHTYNENPSNERGFSHFLEILLMTSSLLSHTNFSSSSSFLRFSCHALQRE